MEKTVFFNAPKNINLKYPYCIGNTLKDFSANKMKIIRLN